MRQVGPGSSAVPVKGLEVLPSLVKRTATRQTWSASVSPGASVAAAPQRIPAGLGDNGVGVASHCWFTWYVRYPDGAVPGPARWAGDLPQPPSRRLANAAARSLAANGSTG